MVTVSNASDLIQILADSSLASKNHEVEFTACTDLGGKNYLVGIIGEQTWMAEPWLTCRRCIHPVKVRIPGRQR